MRIPAAVHIDGTGRIQTVERSANPRYYALIEEFGRLTGVPVLLNTSFNRKEPIVAAPEDAIACYLRSGWMCWCSVIFIRPIAGRPAGLEHPACRLGAGEARASPRDGPRRPS